MASQKRAVLCTRCRRLVSADEKVCPYCGARQPALFGLGPAWSRFFRESFDPVWMLVTACVGLYVASLALDPAEVLRPKSIFDLGSPSGVALYRLGMTGGATWAAGLWWTVLSSVFLHGSLLHIFFNLSWIRALGPLAVDVFGPARFWVLFCLTGIVGFIVSNLLSGAPTIGASGAIFGLFGALLVYGKRRGGHWGQGISRQVTAWAVAGFVFSLAIPATNNVAHAGGFVAGLVLGALLPPAERRQEARGSQFLALLLAAAAVASVVASFVVVSRAL